MDSGSISSVARRRRRGARGCRATSCGRRSRSPSIARRSFGRSITATQARPGDPSRRAMSSTSRRSIVGDRATSRRPSSSFARSAAASRSVASALCRTIRSSARSDGSWPSSSRRSASSRCDGFPNWQHASIPELDEAFESWLRAGPREELRVAASTAQWIAAERLPYVPLVTPGDVWAHTTRLQGFEPHPADLYPLYDLAHLS